MLPVTGSDSALERLIENALPWHTTPMLLLDARNHVEYPVVRSVAERVAEPGSTLTDGSVLWHAHWATRDQMQAAQRRQPERARLPHGLVFDEYDERHVGQVHSTWDPYEQAMSAFVVSQRLYPTAIFKANDRQEMLAYGSVSPWNEMSVGWVHPQYRGLGLFNQVYWRIAARLFDEGDPIVIGTPGDYNKASLKSSVHMGMKAAGFVTRSLQYVPAHLSAPVRDLKNYFT